MLSFYLLHGLGLPLIFAQFTSLPENPQIGENVFLICRLNTGEQRFTSTTPSLKINESLYSFSFHEITDKLKDGRYYGSHLPDLHNRKNLRGDISIFYIREQDLTITFTCTAQLDNDTFIEYALKLNTTQHDTPILNCTPAKLTSINNLLTDPTNSPTHFTCNQEECTLWKALFGTFTPFAAILLILVIICVAIYGVAIYLRRKGEQKYEPEVPYCHNILNSSKVNQPKFPGAHKRSINNPKDNNNQEEVH